MQNHGYFFWSKPFPPNLIDKKRLGSANRQMAVKISGMKNN